MAEDNNKDELFTARRSESVDAEGVALLINRQTEAIFGRVNPDEVIEKANLAISLVNEEGKVLAFAAFNDHPSVYQSSWEDWIQSTYSLDLHGVPPNTLNSLFLRLFVAQNGYSQAALAEILKTVFIAVPLLHNVFLCPQSSLDQTLSLHFAQITSAASEETEDSSSEKEDIPLLYIACRHDHYPVLHVRSAKPEDNDDLLPIIQQSSSNELSDQYGDYFIAELIESQDNDHQTIVAEVQGRAVGFISVTTEVNLSLLWDHYQLEPYHGLRKPCQEDVITTASNALNKLSTSNSSHSSASGGGNSVHSKSITPLPQEKLSTVSTTSTVPPAAEEKLEQASLVMSASESTSGPPVEVTRTYLLCGPSNALSVQLFSISELYEMRSIDLLPAVFLQFPELDFLILTLPSHLPHFPLLSHFTHVNQREGSTLNQELYILHKCSLLHSLKVRPLEQQDVPGIETLVTTLASEKSILEDVNHFVKAKRDPLDEDGTPIHAYVVELMEQIVGVVIVREEEDLHYLTSHYNIEDFVYLNQHTPQEHMHLHHFLINPIFAPHVKHILKDTMRLSNSNNLYYPLPLSTSPHCLTHSLTLALQDMVPIRPRRQILYPNNLGANAPMKNVRKQLSSAALYHTNRKLSLEPKISINTRIVFVGASDTAMSCLESLVFSPHLKFNNLILLSPQGLPTTSNVLSDSCCFFDDALGKIGFEAWITVIPGCLQSIDRRHQFITMETILYENCLLHYDYLVLSSGVQYAPEIPHEGSLPQSVNIVTLSGDVTDEKIMKRAREELQDEGNAVVYGSTIDAYCVVRYLIEVLSLPGERITLVLPTSSPVCLKNTVVDQMINEAMKKEDITVIEKYSVHRYFTDSINDLRAIELVHYDSDGDPEYTTVSCKVMFCLETDKVNMQAFKAINDACLVFDRRLVIDSNNSTNDPKILGAGPLTKYSRYYRTLWSHKLFNSQEVGERLAETLLSKVDPTHNTTTSLSQQDDTANTNSLIPSHYKPNELYAQLPGHYYYLHIDKPQTTNKKEMGQAISTRTDNGYFQLYINQYHRIETITVLSNKPFEVSNYRCLYNQHEQYLNNLLTRWSEGLITDLYLYFREQWTCAIFHDRFTDFVKEINGLLSEGEGSMKEKVTEIIQDSSVVSLKNNTAKLASAYTSCNLESSLHKRLHHYLLYNHNHLPMYAQQDMV